MPTLQQLDDAILRILEMGQSVEIDGQRYELADLDKLRVLRAEIKAEAAALSAASKSTSILDRAFIGIPRRT